MVQTELTALVERARTGDRQAQETLLAEVQNRVYYHCKKMMKNDSDAQDATQDVLITVLTSLNKLREPAAFYGWVNGITANRCKHLLTQGTHEWQIPETENGDSMLDSLEDLEKQGIKLYSIAPLPLLLLLFLHKDASQSGMTSAQSAQVNAAVMSAVQPGPSGTGSARG